MNRTGTINIVQTPILNARCCHLTGKFRFTVPSRRYEFGGLMLCLVHYGLHSTNTNTILKFSATNCRKNKRILIFHAMIANLMIPRGSSSDFWPSLHTIKPHCKRHKWQWRIKGFWKGDICKSQVLAKIYFGSQIFNFTLIMSHPLLMRHWVRTEY